jgi:hypothetical protein
MNYAGRESGPESKRKNRRQDDILRIRITCSNVVPKALNPVFCQ